MFIALIFVYVWAFLNKLLSNYFDSTVNLCNIHVSKFLNDCDHFLCIILDPHRVIDKKFAFSWKIVRHAHVWIFFQKKNNFPQIKCYFFSQMIIYFYKSTQFPPKFTEHGAYLPCVCCVFVKCNSTLSRPNDSDVIFSTGDWRQVNI